MDCSLNTIPAGAQSPAKSAKNPDISCAGAARPSKLAGLPLDALTQYFDACQSTATHLVGFASRPINRGGAGEDLMNPIIEHLDREAQRAIDAVKAYQPANTMEAGDRARFLIAWECAIGEGLSEIAALAATLAVPERH